MLEQYEEINLDLILERAGLFRNEFETDEYDAVLYNPEIKELLYNLLSYDKEIVNCIKELSDVDINNDYLTIHRKFIETILNTKNQVKEENFQKQMKSIKLDYKVERLLRQSDLSYVLNKYLRNEPITEQLLYMASLDYYMDFIIKTILNNYEDDIPNEFKTVISNRLEELNKFIPKEQ